MTIKNTKAIKSLLLIALTLVLFAGCVVNPGSGPSSTKEPEKEEPTAAPIDETKFPFYVEDYSSIAYTKEEYEDKISTPYWMGNVIYNELALPFEYDDGNVYAKLDFTPLKVFSVMDVTLKKTYEEGKDYIIDAENRRLVIPEGSSIPTIYINADKGQNPPKGYQKVDGMPDGVSKYTIWNGVEPFVYTESPYFYAQYLSISYVYDMKELPTGIFAEYNEATLPKFHAKMKTEEKLNVVVYGDSITAGCSSTGDMLNTLPRTPGFVNQIKKELKKVSGNSVNLKNYGVGGTTSSYPLNEGKSNLDRASENAPDLCIIAYGMNDADGSEAAFKANILAIMNKMKEGNPDIEFILVNSFTSNPAWGGDGKFTKFAEALKSIKSEMPAGSVEVVDIYPISTYYLQTKKFCEISSSNVNHPNDYLHRMYAMNIMSVLYDYMGTK